LFFGIPTPSNLMSYSGEFKFFLRKRREVTVILSDF